MTVFERALAAVYKAGYQRAARPLLFRGSAQDSHVRVLHLLASLDRQPRLTSLLAGLRKQAQPARPVSAGGVSLPSPLVVAAGLVKGLGYRDEDAALTGSERDSAFMPGWFSVARLCGPVEFGSFTRWPRVGNPGTVIWRDAVTQSTQNRVGLKNPGARAAAAFLSSRWRSISEPFGINIAVSPGVTDPALEEAEVLEALQFFLDVGVFPGWFTLNLSCPNTEDDPTGNQTEAKAARLGRAVVSLLDRYSKQAGKRLPLWVKISPGLSAAQYQALMTALSAAGVAAVVATNTLGQPAPGQPELTAGVGGGRLHPAALEAVLHLQTAKEHTGSAADVIACGGIVDGNDWREYQALGVQAGQYWSALVYRGLWAAAVIEGESKQNES